MSYILNSLQGVISGVIRGDTTSLEYPTCLEYPIAHIALNLPLPESFPHVGWGRILSPTVAVAPMRMSDAERSFASQKELGVLANGDAPGSVEL